MIKQLCNSLNNSSSNEALVTAARKLNQAHAIYIWKCSTAGNKWICCTIKNTQKNHSKFAAFSTFQFRIKYFHHKSYCTAEPKESLGAGQDRSNNQMKAWDQCQTKDIHKTRGAVDTGGQKHKWPNCLYKTLPGLFCRDSTPLALITSLAVGYVLDSCLIH